MKFQISVKILKCFKMSTSANWVENISWILCCVALCALPNFQQTCASIATVCKFIIDKTGYVLQYKKIE